MKFAVSELKLLPPECSFEIISGLSREMVVSRLRAHVAPRHILFFNSENDFEGEIYESEFEIRESVGYNYSLLPVFRGYLEKREQNVVVRVKASNMITLLGASLQWACAVGLVSFGVGRLFRDAPDWEAVASSILCGIFVACVATFTSTFYWRKIGDGKDKLVSIIQGS